MNGKSSHFAPRLIYLRDLVRELVIREIKLMYKGSVLGIAWSLIYPLLLLLVFQFIFGLVFSPGVPHYASFVFIGILIWSWFQMSLIQSAGSIISGRDLIKHPGFPSQILPIVMVTTHMVYFLLALPILLVFLTFFGPGLGSAIVALPLVMVIQFVLTLSLAYLVATACVFFRDIQQILTVVLQLLFFLSPIFYDARLIPDAYQPFYQLNPMVHLLSSYRAILLMGEFPNFMPIFVFGILSIGFLYFSYRMFVRVSYRFAEAI